MSRTTARLLYWSPRVLCIAFALFLSLFALDVFDEFHGFWLIVAAFAIHLIPAMVIVVVLIAAWRWEWLGGALFLLAAVYYAVHMLNRSVNNWPAVLSISFPLLVIAALFLTGWIERSKVRPALARVF